MSPGEFDREAFLAALKESGALQFGTFTLASGRTSSYYVDIKRAVTRPDLLRRIAEAIAPYAHEASRVAGVELGAVPIATAVSLVTDKPYIIVRKQLKEHGTRKEYEGDLAKGDKVLFVEDVVTTGGTLCAAIERLRRHGAVIDEVVTVVDREEGGRMALAEISVRMHALLRASDLLASA